MSGAYHSFGVVTRELPSEIIRSQELCRMAPVYRLVANIIPTVGGKGRSLLLSRHNKIIVHWFFYPPFYSHPF